MKVSGLIFILFLVGMLIVVALGVVGIHSQRDNSRLLESVVADLTDRSRRLEDEVRQLQATNAHLEAAAAVVAPPPFTNVPPAKPQAFQARAFVGNEYVGMAWVIPSNVKADPETGMYLFEPVIRVDEKARKAFTQTNIVERDVYRSTVNQNWNYSQPYWYGYPILGNSRPGQPTNPPPIRPIPVLPSPGGSQQFLPPGNLPLANEGAGRLLPNSGVQIPPGRR